jgi:integrase
LISRIFGEKIGDNQKILERDIPKMPKLVLAAMRRMGIGKDEMCGHGFRATARTILAQNLHIRTDLIEQELGHHVIDSNGRAYNRTTFLPERRLMMQVWADYLDKLKDGGETRPKKEERLTDIRSIMVGHYD